MTARNGSSITWYSFDMPATINSGSQSSQFSYGPDRRRFKQFANYSGGTETTYYIGGLLEKLVTPVRTHFRHQIMSPDGLVASYVRKDDSTEGISYFTKDHLGSVDSISNASGTTILSYDPFGKRRNAATWVGAPPAGDMTSIANASRHGYTEHEMLDNLGLIHMNGRVQDPLLARFLSPDPSVPYPDITQSFNRYSYVQNNPLSRVDPDGFDDLGIQIQNEDIDAFSSMMQFMSFAEGTGRDPYSPDPGFGSGLQSFQQFLGGFRGVNGPLQLTSAWQGSREPSPGLSSVQMCLESDGPSCTETGAVPEDPWGTSRGPGSVSSEVIVDRAGSRQPIYGRGPEPFGGWDLFRVVFPGIMLFDGYFDDKVPEGAKPIYHAAQFLGPGSKIKAARTVVAGARAVWTITREGTERVLRHDLFGRFYKSKSDGLWWVKDLAAHGGSEWKVFKETSKGLEWFRDADKFGDFILDKHKSDIGAFIPWKELAGTAF
jgi:RHS repeat-associated protein